MGARGYPLLGPLSVSAHTNFASEINLLLVYFFKLKETPSDELRSHIIYKYICDACQAMYYRSTVKQSKIRFSQHFGKFHRTSLPISKPLQSSIRDYCLNNDHPMRMRNFNILAYAEDYNLKTLESIFISKNKPELNIDQSAVPLATLYFFSKTFFVRP